MSHSRLEAISFTRARAHGKPSIDEKFPGLRQNVDYFHWGMAAQVDYRDNPGAPRRGGNYYVRLGLQLRSLGAGGVGRYLKQTNNWILKVTGGMGVMRERFADTDSAQVNVEGLTALNLDFFRFEGNERDISANVYFWPSLTDFGRVRLDFDATLRYKIFKDFTWGFSFWNNFDSQPATDAGKNDFGLSSTIGYKF